MCAAVTNQEMHELSRALYRDAMAGDRAAAALLLSYILGRPDKVVDPDAVVHTFAGSETALIESLPARLPSS